MSEYKIIRSGEAESTYEMKNKNSQIEKKFHDEDLQISVLHISSDRILYVEPLPSNGDFKTYYIVKGACFVFEDASIVKSGDIVVFKNTSEVHTLKTLEDTTIVVHATNYDVYKTLENHHGVVDRLIREIQDKDHYTGEHSQRVFDLVKQLAVRLGYKSKALNLINKAAFYHDLGKIKIPDEILNKPGALDQMEFEAIKLHVEHGKKLILENFSPEVFEIIYQHHERIDGTGYPNGLKGDEICFEAKILAVCDSYDAMITDRVYKKGKSIEAALLELKELSGTKYDSEVVSAFVEMILDNKTSSF
ncbi:MAG: hypothetical protein BGO41_09700 [Clostridiales bacterium 38-18]|nr:MAG: hypothetical protein BGO41_09700 [Clostridiales bacterium 38-18]